MAEEPPHKRLERLGEQAYDELYDTRYPTGCWSDIKDYFVAAIAAAEEVGLGDEAERLRPRLAHIRNVYRHQFT